MNSLTELNGYVTGFSLPYTDERLPDVLFDRAAPTNQTQSVDRGFTISGSVGMDILEILNAPSSNPTYTIDVTSLAGATVSYASLPPGVSLLNPSTGVYVITGFVDKAQWDLIKSPTIDFSDDFVGSFTYTSTVSFFSYYTGATTYTWTTAVTVNNILFWTNSTQFIYSLSAVSNITGEPNLGNLDAAYPGATWTVTITPSSIDSINTFTTTGTGGTFSVNGSTKVITISGTRAQVNSRLQGLQVDANALSIDFVLTYFAQNSVNAVTDTRTQNMLSQGLAVLGSVSQPTIYYTEDTNFTIIGAPLITDTIYDGTGTYSYTITPSDVAAISTATIGGSGGTASFNNSTKVITISGTRTQVNGRLSSITITPTVDYAQNFNLQYFCSTPRADTANKIQVAAIGSNDTEITNMNISRSFTANNANSIFSTNTPFISDLDASNPTYTIILNCPNGQWTGPTSISPYIEGTLINPLSITGTKAFINARFQFIKFYPNAGLSSNTTFTFTQIKNGVTQVSQTVALLGSAGSYSGSRVIDFLFSQNWTPTFTDALYGKIDELLVVGGGGGGTADGAGGGGGQVKYSTPNTNLTNQTYVITVGGGGFGGNLGENAVSGLSSVAFGVTALGGGGAQGLVGGSSYAPNGTLNSGGSNVYPKAGGGVWTVPKTGGGGAGSGGSIPSLIGFKYNLQGYDAESPDTIDAYIGATSGIPAFLSRLIAGNGGIGVDIGGTWGQASAYPTTSDEISRWKRYSYNYGFGGAGGSRINPNIDPPPREVQYSSDSYNTSTVRFSRGGFWSSFSPSPADYYISGVRQPTVAGGGGAGGGDNVKSKGGDGIVRIRIGTR
jgi:hypothetical protein